MTATPGELRDRGHRGDDRRTTPPTRPGWKPADHLWVRLPRPQKPLRSLSALSRWESSLPAARVSVTGEATGVATLDVIAVGRASAVSGMAPVAPDGAFPIGAGSSFRHVFSGLLLPVSLWALAAGALPGASGLVILFATGARLGYRQAKAGVALRTTGIAFFARPGPLGIVRPRALRVVRPGALSAEHLLDKVA